MTVRARINSFAYRRWTIWLVVMLSITAVVLAVIFSPLAIKSLSSLMPDWTLGSEIGQTYGAASALLSSLAVVGVAASLLIGVVQSRQAKIAAVREMHAKLIDQSLADPTYFPCWGSPLQVNMVDIRLFAYINTIISYWEAKWDLGVLDKAAVRTHALGFFRGELPRQYWKLYGEGRLASARTRKHRVFLRVLDETYSTSIAGGPATVPIPATRIMHKEKPPALTGNRRVLTTSVAAGLTWLVISVAYSKLKRRSK